MHPPHLPPKTSNVEFHHLWKRLKWLLAIVLFSVVAGMSGASMMLGWIWPRFAEGDMWVTSYTRPGLTRAQLESHIREEVSSRIVSVYKISSNINGAGYLNKKIGDGVILSSDGWLAMYQPNYDGAYKGLNVVAGDGKVWQPEKALWDKYSGILYIKIPDGQFKVAGFVDENSALDEVFIFHNSYWYHGSVLYPSLNYQIPHLDSAPLVSYSLNGSFNVGEVAINNQGRIVGFITEKNLLLPSYYITRILPNVLNKQSLSYPSLGVDGWFSEEQTIVSDKTKITGFLVTNVWSAPNQLRRGDVIREINGRIVTTDNLWYIVSNSQTLNLKVLRAGKVIDVTVKLVQTK